MKCGVTLLVLYIDIGSLQQQLFEVFHTAGLSGVVDKIGSNDSAEQQSEQDQRVLHRISGLFESGPVKR